MTKLRLKVCPFCGAEADYYRPSWTYGHADAMWNVACPHGHATSPDMDTKEEARDWWNRRHVGPQYARLKK